MTNKISVVVPNYNGEELLRKHLPKVIEAVSGAEIIVVDDASTDDSVAVLQEQFPQVHLIQHTKNQRFAAACNTGVAAAEGKIVVLLNNDVSPQKDFLKHLLVHFDDEKVFAVGCNEIEKREGTIIESGRSEGAFRRGFLVHWRAEDQTKTTTLWAAGGSMAVRKSLWQKLGGMDTLYRPAYWEDIDLSYRALKRGYKVLFEPKAVVEHKHETTNVVSLGKRVMKISAYKNQILFVWKNITDIMFIIQHCLWLPYHLLVTSVRTHGEFLLGFLAALYRLPMALRRRKKTSANMLYSDSDILGRSER